MTVNANIPVSGPYATDGVKRVWAYTFKAIRIADLRLVLTNDATGVEVLVTGGFTATGLGGDAGGDITYPIAPTAPLAAGITVRPIRQVALGQPNKIGNQGEFFPQTHEQTFDLLAMQVEDISAKLDRAVIASFGIDPDAFVGQLLAASATAVAAAASALVSETNADTSEANAAASALLASRFATYPEDTDIPGTGGLRSALHWAAKSAASAAAAATIVAAAFVGAIAGFTAKTTPADGDQIGYRQVSDGTGRTSTWLNLKNAFFTALGPLIAAATSKATPVDADGFVITDSAASSAPKLLTFINLKAWLVAQVLTWTAKQTFQNAAFTTAVVDLVVGQIKFPAAVNVSADPNTLDDYEEGTFVPTLTTSGVVPTGVAYAVQSGQYTKIGNLVAFKLRLTLTNRGAGGTGNVLIAGLPFPSTAAGDEAACAITRAASIDFATGYTQLCAGVGDGTSVIELHTVGDNVATVQVVWGDLNAAGNSSVHIAGTYFAA